MAYCPGVPKTEHLSACYAEAKELVKVVSGCEGLWGLLPQRLFPLLLYGFYLKTPLL